MGTGVVSTLASEKEGESSAAASTHRLVSVAVDSRSNIYVCDTLSHVIRKRNVATGEWSVLIGTEHPPTATATPAPVAALAVDDSKADSKSAVGASAVPALPSVESAPPLKDGPVASAALWYPTAICIDTKEDELYIADAGHFVVRKVKLRETITRGRTASASGNGSITGIESVPNLTIRTLSGRARSGYRDGTPEEALFGRLSGIAIDSKANVYVSDIQHHTIRKITPDGMVSTWAGRRNVSGSTDGVAAAVSTDSNHGGEATFNAPLGLCLDPSDNLFVCDSGNGWIRKVTADGTTRRSNSARRARVGTD